MRAAKTACPSVYDRTSCHVTFHYNVANEGGSQIQECVLDRDPIHPDFPRTVPILLNLHAVFRQILFGTPNFLNFFQVIKLGIRNVPILAGQYQF
jgi:hypothetical protein